MGDQLLMGQHRNAPRRSNGKTGLPSRHHHQIPAAEITHTIEISQWREIGIQGTQQGTAAFHISQPSKQPARNPLGCERALLWAAHTDEAMGSPGSTQLLQPHPTDDAPHRKTQKIYRRVIAKALADVIVQLFRKRDEGNSTQAMRKMGHEHRPLVGIQSANQTIEQTW